MVVSACTNAISTPTTMPTIISGADSLRITKVASRPISITVTSFIAAVYLVWVNNG